MGILRSGHTMFLISPRNAPAAVVDMLRKTNCRHVLVSQDTLIQELVHNLRNAPHHFVALDRQREPTPDALNTLQLAKRLVPLDLVFHERHATKR